MKDFLFSIKFWNRQEYSGFQFKSCCLPDEGRELFKPSMEIFLYEMKHISNEKRKNTAILKYQKGDQRFEHSNFHEAVHSYSTSLEAIESLSGYLSLGVSLMMISEFQEAGKKFEIGLDLANQYQDKQFQIVFLINLGQTYIDLGKLSCAQKTLENAHAICQKIENQNLSKMTLLQLALLQFIQGLYDEAIDYCNLVGQFSNKKKNDLNFAKSLFVKGVLLMSKGSFEDAESILKKGINQLEDIQNSYIEARLYSQISQLYLLKGNIHQALATAKNALRIFQSVLNPQGEARILGLLSAIHFAMGHIEEGDQFLQKALDLDRKSGYKRGVIRQLLMQADVYLKRSQLDEAYDSFRKAHEMARLIGHKSTLLTTTPMLAILARDMSESERISVLFQCLDLSRKISMHVQEIHILLSLSSLFNTHEKLDKAEEYCKEALAKSRSLGYSLEEAKIHGVLSQIFEHKGEKDLAIEHIGISQAILQSIGIPIPS